MNTFNSKFSQLQLVMKPGGWQIDSAGRRTILPGRLIQFQDGIYNTQDPEEIAFLRQHPAFGVLLSEPLNPDYQKIVKQKFNKKGK